MIDFDALKAPFPPGRISWRVGSTNQAKTKGMALAYIDARDVMERLDQAIGAANWQCRYPHAGQKTVCEIGIYVGDGNWVWKADGAGDTDFEADKGALSDAFKRAAVRWGIGRYLYDLSAPWVEIEPMGKSFRIKDDQMGKLQKLLVMGNPAPASTAPAMPPKKDPLQPWKGPLTKTELQKRLRALTSDIALCEDMDMLKSCESGYQGIIDQVKIDVPEWWDGEPDGNGFVPLKRRLADCEATLALLPNKMMAG